MNHFFARIEIQLLMNATARAFHQKPLRVWTCPYAKALSAYAASTCDWMKHCTGESFDVQTNMYREAFRLGKLIRRLSFFLNDRIRTKIVFSLYRCIGITMYGQLPGAVEVSRCFFGSYYTPDMCRMISAMDDGVISGIMGGGKFRFSQRMTEGSACCRACLARRDTYES